MTSVALKGLLGRKLRAILTAFSVVLGVAMVTGSFVLTDSIQQAFHSLFSSSYSNTDAVITGKKLVDYSNSGNATIPASLLATVRAQPDVARAEGVISDMSGGALSAKLYDKKGKIITGGGNPTMGVGIDPRATEFNPMHLTSGRWASAGGEVVIDKNAAGKYGFSVGDTTKVAVDAGVFPVKIVGIARYGNVDSLGGATFAVFDISTAQKLFKLGNSFTAISVEAKRGLDATSLVDKLRGVTPATAQVRTGADQAAKDEKDVAGFVKYIRYFLVGFGMVALFVGGFVIFNILSITVAQRTRELATLRTLGASRKQVMRSVRLEGFVIGLVASVIGLVMGLAIAKGMIALFSAMGVQLPDAGTVIATHTITVSLIVGTGVTLLASILPARRATRVPPIAAVREGSVLPASRFEAHSAKTGVGVLLASLAAISAGMFANGTSVGLVALLIAGGVLGLFAAIALLAPSLVKPLTRVVGWPSRSTGGVAGELAGANAGRNPKRTASTAAALMIGLTLVTVVAVLGAGMNAGTKAAISKQVHADHVIDGSEGLPFRASEGDRLAAIDGVTAASHVRSDDAIVQGKQSKISGIDPATISHFYSFKWTTGSQRTLDQLSDDGAIVTKTYAHDKHLKVGSDVSIKSPNGKSHTVVVRGLYDPPEANPMLADVVVTQKAFDSAYSQPKNSFTFLDAKPGSADVIKHAAKGYGDAKYHTGAAYPKDATKDMQVVLAMLYVLLGFSVIVSLFGMVNTMVLSVFERTREIGMLRTIGMTRRQARRMIRHESIITALIGAALGIGLGLFLSGLVVKAVSMDGLPFALPVQPLAAFTLLAVLAGIGAAVMPARRASRLNVLEALQYE